MLNNMVNQHLAILLQFPDTTHLPCKFVFLEVFYMVFHYYMYVLGEYLQPGNQLTHHKVASPFC